MTASYAKIAELVSRVRNARFGEMVTYLEQLIEAGDWQDFTTPVGTHFQFRPWEFDYFLAAQEIDPTVVRWSYLKADGVDDLAAKQLRLADITGRGAQHADHDRRLPEEVASSYDADPSGAGSRIREWAKRSAPGVVTKRTAMVARDPKRRKDWEAGLTTTRTEPERKRWMVEWRDNRASADVIVDKLLKDPDLAHQVYKLLDATESRRRYDQNRRPDS